jgi:hypothetical protein
MIPNPALGVLLGAAAVPAAQHASAVLATVPVTYTLDPDQFAVMVVGLSVLVLLLAVLVVVGFRR